MAQIPQKAGIYFLLAAGLRLGVLPLNLPVQNSSDSKHGSALLIRLAPVASSLALIANLPQVYWRLKALCIPSLWSSPPQPRCTPPRCG
jgi:hypothetical protein